MFLFDKVSELDLLRLIFEWQKSKKCPSEIDVKCD